MFREQLYTIGYATKPIETFIQQLHRYQISAVADVRSVPYSKAFQDYRRETLAEILKAEKIHYVYLGDELGPRSKHDEYYDESNQIRFDWLMYSELFLQGIKRVQAGLEKDMRIAMMCAEKDPINCHRSLLVGYYLRRELNMDVNHIKYEGELESQTDMEKRLAELHDIGNDLFSAGISLDEKLDQACRVQSSLKAYRRPE
jgi:uncharacterized protein (DUF488 family)